MQNYQRICFAALFTVIFAGAVLTGCNEPEQTELPPEFHEEMIADSLVSTGNTARLNRVFEKAQAGEDITITYVGGSATEGYGVDIRSPECYASLTSAEFQEHYCCGGTVTCQNVGYGGTSSLMGCLRADSAVLSSHPDIVFVEYAISDGTSDVYQTAYESLVRTCLESPDAPAVILLFTYKENGYSCQEQQEKIGAYYDLGMISLGDALEPRLEDGRMTWSEYSKDNSYPSENGHRLLADMTAYYFEAAKNQKPDQDYEIPAESLSGDLYRNGSFCDSSNVPYSCGSWEIGSHNNILNKGFVHQPDSGNTPLTMDVSGRALFLVYKKYSDPTWGIAEIYVNGELVNMISSNYPNCFGGAAVNLIAEYNTVQDMHVEIKMLDDQANRSFEVLALGVCE